MYWGRDREDGITTGLELICTVKHFLRVVMLCHGLRELPWSSGSAHFVFFQGTPKVVERPFTMRQIKQAVEEGRVSPHSLQLTYYTYIHMNI